MYILKEVYFMTTSVAAIHSFYGSVITSVVDSRKSWKVCSFQESHFGPALLEVPIYSTELVAIFFFLKSTVLNTQKHLHRSHGGKQA